MSDLTIQLTVTANAASPRIPLPISKEISSSELRRLVSEKTMIPQDKLRLITRGKLISDNDSNRAVAEYKLEEGTVLHCMGKPEGTTAPAAAAAAAPAPSATTAGSSVTVQPQAAASTTAAASSANPLQEALAAMKSGNSPTTYKTAVTTLEKILSNIINKPMEEKYRKVKKQNAAFQKKLGGVTGADNVMKACGFAIETEEGEEVYLMHASAEKWPQLVAAKSAVEAAAREANASADQASAPPAMPGMGAGAGMPNFGAMPGMGAGMNPGVMGPDMQAAATRMMQDPNMLQSMLQNPMVQNMMRNDPRFANNPMARQSMEQVMNNPQMLQQISQMMRDPNMQQQLQQMMGGAGGGMGGMPPGGFSGMPPFGGMPPAAGNAGGTQQQQGNGASNAGGSGGNDQDQTEEEMIAEAIRRSLEEGGS